MEAVQTFIWDKLYPAIFEHVPQVFPEMDFKKRGNKWVSSKYLDGTQSDRKDKTQITEKWIGNIYEQGSGSVRIIEHYGKNNGFHNVDIPGHPDFWECLKRLCSIVNIEAPERSEEWERKYHEEKTRQDLLLASYERQKKALFSPEGSHVLNYLKTFRRYTDEEIKKMGLGYISTSEAERLKQETNIGINTYRIKDYPLSWGLYSMGRIYGFKFRVIMSEEERKEKKIPKYDLPSGLEKKSNPFGLTAMPQPRNGKNLIVVTEGELDALHCIAKGIQIPTIATTGNGLSTEDIIEIKKKRYDHIILLLDNDDNGQKFVKDSIKNIEEQGLNAFVATLPEGSGHDPDEFFRYGNTIADLHKIISSAKWGGRYLYDKLIEEYGYPQDDLLYNELEEKFIDLVSCFSNLTLRHNLLFDFSTRYGHGSVSQFEKAITSKVDRDKSEKERSKKKEALEEALKKALSDLQEGKNIESAKTLSNIQKGIQVLADRDKYKDYLFSNSDEIFQSLKVRPKGLNSGFQIESESNVEKKYQELIFPEGGISLIGGSTNHGKSTVLKNIVLNALEERDPKTNRPIEGTLLYFTFEENVEAVTRQFINAYANVNLNPEDPKRFRKSNIEIIEEVLSGYDTNLVHNNDKKKEFFTKVREFKKILEQQRLKIIRLNSNFHDELSGVVRFLKDEFHDKIRAVFVDYVQCLSVDNNGKTTVRTEELKEIMTSLDKEVQFLKIPFIMTAQLKRDVKSFDKLTNQDFDQSSWIEKTASEIVLLWSNRFKCEPEAKDTRLRDGQGGVIGARLTKSRRYGIPSVMYLDIKETTGRITQSNKVNITKEDLHQFDIDAVLEDTEFESAFFKEDPQNKSASNIYIIPKPEINQYSEEDILEGSSEEAPF